MKADAKGHWAEFLARLLFRLKGYRIVAVNYVTGRGTNAGEVDFVACRQNVIVFVEVKQRSSLEKAAYAVKPRQQRRIWRAAEAFLQMRSNRASSGGSGGRRRPFCRNIRNMRLLTSVLMR